MLTRVAKMISDSRVAIVGGSISGCATYQALKDILKEPPTIFERSSKELEDRGMGIGIPLPTQKALLEGGFVTSGLQWNQAKTRHWIVRDGDSRFGRLTWETPFPVQLHNWGLLWKELRSQVDDSNYMNNVFVSGIHVEEDGVKLTRTGINGQDEESLGKFDVVIAADGVGSLIRKIVVPDSFPVYSGTVLWRGVIDLDDLSPEHKETFVDNSVFSTVGFEGGHGIFYAIPTADTTRENHSYLLNWGTYTHTPSGLSFPEPGVIRNIADDAYDFFDKVAVANLPPLYQEIIQKTKNMNRVSIHPIFDESPDRYVDQTGRLILLGDAGAILRPHTASGTTKAIQDVLYLRDLCSQEGADWKDVAQKYQEQRREDGDKLVALGQRLGEAQVLHTPDWGNMSPDEYQAWIDAQTSGSDNYMYKKKVSK
jgi:2-polyprenyl-6-methoxyphenol hydroxylase-like FAD-dependent oxidoreductase